MGESVMAYTCVSRASEEWAAPFKNRLETSLDNGKSDGIVGDVRSLALSTFAYGKFNHTENLNNLDQLLAKLEADTANRFQFRKLGCIPLLVHHMAKNMRHTDIQIACCHMLTSLADRDEDAQVEIGKWEGIAALLDVLHTFKEQPRVCEAAFSSLRGLTLVEDNRKVMIADGVLECVISALRNFMEHENLVLTSVATLARVVFGRNDTRVAFGEMGGILLITQVLQRYESSSGMQAETALALRNLSFGCVANHDRMNEANTIDVLFRGLRNHVDDHLVTNQTLAAIGNIVTMDSVAKKRILLKRTHVAQLFRTFTSFATDCCLCRKICSILLHLCAYDPLSDRSSINIVSLCGTEEGGCLAIVSAMESSLEIDNPLLAKLACLTHELSSNEAFRQKIGESGALRFLLKSLHIESTDVLKDVLCCIGAILSGNDENKRQFSKIGGFPVVIAVMNKYTTNELLIENCCKVLDIGADGQNVTCADLVQRKEDVVAAGLRAMKEFPRIARVQEYSCSLLIKVAIVSEEDSSHMVKVGVRDAAEMTRSMHSGNTAVESLANQLLSLLVDKRGKRRGRGTAAGNSSERPRSRSRTIGDRNRSRQGRSKSPTRLDRGLEAGRRAMLAAKARSGSDGSSKEEAAPTVFEGLSARRTERAPKKNLSLEPIWE